MGTKSLIQLENYLGKLFLIFVIYMGLNLLTLYLRQDTTTPSVAIANAFLLSFILRDEKHFIHVYLVICFFGAFIGSLLATSYIGYATLMSVASLVEVLVVVVGLRLYQNKNTFQWYERPLEVLAYIFLGCILSAAITTFIDNNYMTNFVMMLSGSLFGMALLLPFGLTMSKSEVRRFDQTHRLTEFLLMIVANILTVTCACLYTPFPYILISLPLLISAMRFGFFGTSIVCIFSAITFILIEFEGLFTLPKLFPNAYNYTQLMMALTILGPMIVAYLTEKNSQTLQALTKSEERFKGAMQNSAIGMAIVSTSGQWLEVNQAISEITGYSREELLKLTFQDITYPDDLAADLGLLKQLSERKINSYQLEKRYITKSKEVRWILLVVSAVFDDNNHPLYYVSQIEDINSRKKIEAALLESEERWKFALEGGGQGVWDLNPKTKEIFFSRGWKSMLGYEMNEVPNRLDEWFSRIHPDDYERVITSLQKLQEGKKKEFTGEYRLACKDGSYKWVLDRGKIISYDDDNKPIRLIGTYTDINSIKDAEEKLHKLTSRLLLATSAGKIGIFEIDIKKNILTWDKRMYEMHGMKQTDQPQSIEAWLACIHPEDVTRIQNEYSMALHTSEPFDTEYRIIKADGEVRYVRASAMVKKSSEGVALFLSGINWDVTHERNMGNELHQEKERLQITLRSIADAVITTDYRGKITFINPPAEKMLGCRLDKVINQDVRSVVKLFSEDTGYPLDNPLISAMAEHKTAHSSENVILKNQSGENIFVQTSSAPILSYQKATLGGVLVMRDVTEKRHLLHELEYQATHDNLTRLINRNEFEKRIDLLLESEPNTQHYLCYLDLDRFKIVNDSVGHAAGDHLLCQIVETISVLLRPTDIFARLGGDEFAIVFSHTPLSTTVKFCEKIINSIKGIKFNWEQRIYDVGVCIGITAFKGYTDSFESIMSKADVACYTAKHHGGNYYAIYEDNKSEASIYHHEIKLLSGIKEGIENDNFKIYAHEIRPINKELDTSYYEFLIRFIDHKRIVRPSQFIYTAERYNLMADVDRWMIKKILLEHGEEIASIPSLSFTINLSANSINAPKFLEFLISTLDQTPIPASRIGFELTETAVINNLPKAGEILQAIERYGAFVSLDDFGTGLSSFNYLKHCPVKFVKIDGSFIKMITKSQVDALIVESINELAHKLGALTIAEFVETDEILQKIREINIDYAQGYAIGHEITFKELIQRTRMQGDGKKKIVVK